MLYALVAVFLPAVCLANSAGGGSSVNDVATASCAPEGLPASGCAWTGTTCPPALEATCGDTCVINHVRAASYSTAEDRAWGERWWRMCPRLANLLDLLSRPSGSRRLQSLSQGGGQAVELQGLVESIDAEERSLLAAFSAAYDASSEARGRQLQQASGAAKPEHTLACPTDAEVDALTPSLIQLSFSIEDVLKTNAEGKQLNSEQATWEFALRAPNTWLILLEYLKSPDKIKEYMAANCAATDVTDPLARINAKNYVAGSQNLTDSDTLSVCMDTFGGYQEFHSSLLLLVVACSNPFGIPSDSSCVSNVAPLFVISSQTCAGAWARSYNITGGAETFAGISTATSALHTACGAATTKDDCIAAHTSGDAKKALETIDTLHARLPFKVDSPYTEPFTNPAGAAAAAEAPSATANATGQTVFEEEQFFEGLPPPPPDSDRGRAPPGPLVESDGGSSFPVGAVAGGIGAALLIGALALAALLFMRHKKKARRKDAQANGGAPGYGPHAPAVKPVMGPDGQWYHQQPGMPPAPPPQHPYYHGHYQTPPGYQQPPPGAYYNGSGNASGFGMASGTYSGTPSYMGLPGPSAPPSLPGSAMWEHSNTRGSDGAASFQSVPVCATPEGAAVVQQLAQVLDGMRAMKARFSERYELLGAEERCIGNHGVVQFAQILNSPERAAVKFFIDRAAFSMEQHVCSLDAVQAALQGLPMFMPNSEGLVRSPQGYVFPPHSITDRGEPLEAWMSYNTADLITSVQLLSQVLKVVKALHTAQYAHRNIKPSNIIRRPRQHDWILSDFACAAPLGATGPPVVHASRIRYSAPEIVSESSLPHQQHPPVTVDGAVDVWSVGVIAWELLTQRRVFPEGTTDDDIRAALRTPGRLPWEAGTPEAEAANAQLRGLRRPVLACLERDASKRPSAASLLSSWEHLFDSMKTQGTFESDGGASANGPAPAV